MVYRRRKTSKRILAAEWVEIGRQISYLFRLVDYGTVLLTQALYVVLERRLETMQNSARESIIIDAIFPLRPEFLRSVRIKVLLPYDPLLGGRYRAQVQTKIRCNPTQSYFYTFMDDITTNNTQHTVMYLQCLGG